MNNKIINEALDLMEDSMVEKTFMNRNNEAKRTHRIRPAFIAAAAVFAVFGATAFAAARGGYFSDVKNIFGAVTGSTYNNATDEVSVSATVVDNNIEVTLHFLASDTAPYVYIEQLSFEYTLTDDSGKTILRDTTEKYNYNTAEAMIVALIPADVPENGEYTLTIEKLTSSKKADADLDIFGEWKADITI